jgi:hypothetical protein
MLFSRLIIPAERDDLASFATIDRAPRPVTWQVLHAHSVMRRLSAGQPQPGVDSKPWSPGTNPLKTAAHMGSKTTSAPARRFSPSADRLGSLMPPINPRPPLLLATHPTSSHPRSLLVLSEFQCPSLLTEVLLFTSQSFFAKTATAKI